MFEQKRKTNLLFMVYGGVVQGNFRASSCDRTEGTTYLESAELDEWARSYMVFKALGLSLPLIL
jgi:hypothetical protein